jgi:type IV pilus assembly protein PilA
MLARLHKMQQEREEGFTLIELLVVIIIIGILAAIAIPVFLNQRQKGYDAQAKSDLRNMATAEETWLTDNPTAYTGGATAIHNLVTEGFKSSTNVSGWAATATGDTEYVLTDCSQSGKAWQYDSSGAAGVTPASPATCTFVANQVAS